jgi:hypothetical protein
VWGLDDRWIKWSVKREMRGAGRMGVMMRASLRVMSKGMKNEKSATGL